jgi:serine/threonine-protein kinase
VQQPEDVIQFIRKRDYVYVRELGQGACGRTVLLHDDLLDAHLVCKKYTPYDESDRRKLYDNFVRETKILHLLYHENVVRVFNSYLYPDLLAGYILMEYVEGHDVDDFLSSNPELINEIFLQTIAGFAYLEANGILHRDIRPQNLLVRADGVVKIIDFGFGKEIQVPEDFNKSVSLNWWCEPPDDFSNDIYDFGTEVYFVGKLFERIIHENGLEQFKYSARLGGMCQRNPDQRPSSFLEVERHLQGDRFVEIEFTTDEARCYRDFADALEAQIPKIKDGAKYQEDSDRVVMDLENAYRSFMLEALVPQAATVVSCFVRGEYHVKKKGLLVSTVRDFLKMMKGASPEKRRIIMGNLGTRLDAIQRYFPDLEDEIPF